MEVLAGKWIWRSLPLTPKKMAEEFDRIRIFPRAK